MVEGLTDRLCLFINEKGRMIAGCSGFLTLFKMHHGRRPEVKRRLRRRIVRGGGKSPPSRSEGETDRVCSFLNEKGRMIAGCSGFWTLFKMRHGRRPEVKRRLRRKIGVPYAGLECGFITSQEMKFYYDGPRELQSSGEKG